MLTLYNERHLGNFLFNIFILFYRADLVGQVVGIEQIKQTLCFVVEFGMSREIWSGRKVRQYGRKIHDVVQAPSSSLAEPSDSGMDVSQGHLVENKSAGVDEEAAAASVAWLGFTAFNDDDENVPTLPTGYDYEDLDAVCGLARGYVGWGSPHGRCRL